MVKRNFKYVLFSFMLMVGLLLCWSSYKLIKLSSLSSSDVEEIVPNSTAFKIKPDGISEVTEDNLVYDLIRKGTEDKSAIESIGVEEKSQDVKVDAEVGKLSQDMHVPKSEVTGANEIKGIEDLINSVDNVKIDSNKVDKNKVADANKIDAEKSGSSNYGKVQANSTAKTTATKKQLKPVTSSNYRWQVQFGSSVNEMVARQQLEKTIKNNRSLFNGVDVILLKSESGGKLIWRLRTKGFETQAKANEFCSKLEKNKISCFVAAK